MIQQIRTIYHTVKILGNIDPCRPTLSLDTAWRLIFQAHKLGDIIHDIDLEALDVKVVSEVGLRFVDLLSKVPNYNFAGRTSLRKTTQLHKVQECSLSVASSTSMNRLV